MQNTFFTVGHNKKNILKATSIVAVKVQRSFKSTKWCSQGRLLRWKTLECSLAPHYFSNLSLLVHSALGTQVFVIIQTSQTCSHLRVLHICFFCPFTAQKALHLYNCMVYSLVPGHPEIFPWPPKIATTSRHSNPLSSFISFHSTHYHLIIYLLCFSSPIIPNVSSKKKETLSSVFISIPPEIRRGPSTKHTHLNRLWQDYQGKGKGRTYRIVPEHGILQRKQGWSKVEEAQYERFESQKAEFGL